MEERILYINEECKKMVTFDTSIQVLENLHQVVQFGRFIYCVYMAKAGGITVPVLLDGRTEFGVGVCMEVPSTVLTFYEAGGKRHFCLRVIRGEVQDGDFRPRQNLDMRVVGRLIKFEKTRLRKVTACNLDFICCSLLIQNESRHKAALQMVAFQGTALQVDSLAAWSLIEIKGRLVNQKYAKGFEINLNEIVQVRKETTSAGYWNQEAVIATG